jgi:hypothetical protein
MKQMGCFVATTPIKNKCFILQHCKLRPIPQIIIGLLIWVLLNIWLIHKSHLLHMQIYHKGNLFIQLMDLFMKSKGIGEINAIFQNNSIKTILQVIHVP